MGILIGLVILVLVLGVIISIAVFAIGMMISFAFMGLCTMAGYFALIALTQNPLMGLVGAVAGLGLSLLLIRLFAQAQNETKIKPEAGSK